MPQHRVADAQRHLPDMRRGEALCAAYETYCRLVPAPSISFEHAVFLVTALVRGDELRAAGCLDCCGLIVVDRFAVGGRRCQNCEDSRQSKLPLS
jgi:hypothetical protein